MVGGGRMKKVSLWCGWWEDEEGELMVVGGRRIKRVSLEEGGGRMERRSAKKPHRRVRWTLVGVGPGFTAVARTLIYIHLPQVHHHLHQPPVWLREASKKVEVTYFILFFIDLFIIIVIIILLLLFFIIDFLFSYFC